MSTDSTLVDEDDLFEQETNILRFIGAEPLAPNSIFIILLGNTGTGKSRFASSCSGKPLKIGHGLKSCTEDIAIVSVKLHQSTVYLIDTPGFDDTSRPDIATLRTISTYLALSHANSVALSAVLILHRISDTRVSGSSARSIALLKALCGRRAYPATALVTTMWSRGGGGADDHDHDAQQVAREKELHSDAAFFADLVAAGAQTFRHDEFPAQQQQDEDDEDEDEEERDAARAILSSVVENVRGKQQQQQQQPRLITLAIQRELATPPPPPPTHHLATSVPLLATAAGAVLAAHLDRVEASLVRERASLDDDNREAADDDDDDDDAETMRALVGDNRQRVRACRAQRDALRRGVMELDDAERARLLGRVDDINAAAEADARLEARLAACRRRIRDIEEATATAAAASPGWPGEGNGGGDGGRGRVVGRTSAVAGGANMVDENGHQVFLLHQKIQELEQQKRLKKHYRRKARDAVISGMASGTVSAAAGAGGSHWQQQVWDA
ncbi:GTPase IMAP family member 4 [Lasiodiplodia hormozganensis]|uniref:GTPase IMAP family member 4 n=1 Tax=Lasiodiplodia hormozganensis TaxID=869390 RepID=A0AA39YL28_9PEZI|nr:GTPase IMAP family member 4 [Lasiodiplodia hormozganensis]